MLNFATIGSGWITDEYIAGAKDSGLWNLTAVYSRTYDRGVEYAKKHGATHVFTDLNDMAKSNTFDAVYIASPNSSHYEQCKILLANKKHVICEKPLCAQLDKVKELQSIAKENGVIFLEAIMFMHLPQKQILEDALSKIGKISMAKIDFCQRSSKLDSYLDGKVVPNIFNPELETGALMDLGVYCIYPALYLFGKPSSFDISSTMLDTKADGNGIITMKYPDKIVTLTYSKLGQACANTDFQGDEGTVYVESISRLANISIWRKDDTTEDLFDSEEKYKLMGYESKGFYNFIVDFENHKEYYDRCSSLALDVAEILEIARKKANIQFESDFS